MIEKKEICNVIADFIEDYTPKMERSEKEKAYKTLDFLINKWIREHSEYLDFADEEEKMDSLSCMEFVLEDLLTVLRDRIASSLNNES